MTELNYPTTRVERLPTASIPVGAVRPLEAVRSPLAALYARWHQVITFGAVGGISFVVDVGLYNLLRSTVMDDKPIGAKIVSVIVATIVAWIGNRYLTFREARNQSVLREGLLFAAVNVGGLLISSACLLVSHYGLGFTSQLADNVAGNGAGLVLGTLFRFFAYRYLVFRKGE